MVRIERRWFDTARCRADVHAVGPVRPRWLVHSLRARRRSWRLVDQLDMVRQWQHRLSSHRRWIRDHDGFSGDIFDVHDDLEWEITDGPSAAAPAAARSAWVLAGSSCVNSGDGTADPDGFAVLTDSAPRHGAQTNWLFERPTTDSAGTRALYEEALGLVVVAVDRGVVDYGLSSQHALVRARPVDMLEPPDVEDLLVLTYPDEATRDAAVADAIRLGASVVRPHNPWWHAHAVCVQDGDGFATALAVAAAPDPPPV